MRNRELQLFKPASKEEKEGTTTATLSPHVHFWLKATYGAWRTHPLSTSLRLIGTCSSTWLLPGRDFCVSWCSHAPLVVVSPPRTESVPVSHPFHSPRSLQRPSWWVPHMICIIAFFLRVISTAAWSVCRWFRYPCVTADLTWQPKGMWRPVNEVQHLSQPPDRPGLLIKHRTASRWDILQM